MCVDAVFDGDHEGAEEEAGGSPGRLRHLHDLKRKAGKGRNPRTGEEIKIPATTTVRFKAGKGLKDAVN